MCLWTHIRTLACSTHVNVDIRMRLMPPILHTCLYVYVMCLHVLTYVKRSVGIIG